MRVLGVDVGERRIGVAISDRSRTLARPLTTLTVERTGDGVDRVADMIARLREEDDGLDMVVVGLPVRLDGSKNAATARAVAFVDGLRARVPVVILTEDERLTSREAESRLALYRVAVWMSGQGRHLKAGEYRFDHATTPLEVIDKLARGDVYVINLTFPEGLTVADMAKIFESHGLGPASAFVEAASHAELVRDLDPAARDLEGYLFPETYAMPRKSDATKLIRLMV